MKQYLVCIAVDYNYCETLAYEQVSAHSPNDACKQALRNAVHEVPGDVTSINIWLANNVWWAEDDSATYKVEWCKAITDEAALNYKALLQHPDDEQRVIVKARVTCSNDEWIVKAYCSDGGEVKRYPEADYYAMDREDAEATAKAML